MLNLSSVSESPAAAGTRGHTPLRSTQLHASSTPLHASSTHNHPPWRPCRTLHTRLGLVEAPPQQGLLAQEMLAQEMLAQESLAQGLLAQGLLAQAHALGLQGLQA